MNKHLVWTYFLLSLLLICYGCEDTIDGLTLRSDQNERYYWENNAAASARIAKIMYNESNGSRVNGSKLSMFPMYICLLGPQVIITYFLLTYGNRFNLPINKNYELM